MMRFLFVTYKIPGIKFHHYFKQIPAMNVNSNKHWVIAFVRRWTHHYQMLFPFLHYSLRPIIPPLTFIDWCSLSFLFCFILSGIATNVFPRVLLPRIGSVGCYEECTTSTCLNNHPCISLFYIILFVHFATRAE